MRVIVHLIPSSSLDKIEGWALDADGRKILRVKISAIPQKNKANVALIKLLATTLQVPKARISLVRGTTRRIKHLLIEIDEEEAETLLDKYFSLRE